MRERAGNLVLEKGKEKAQRLDLQDYRKDILT